MGSHGGDALAGARSGPPDTRVAAVLDVLAGTSYAEASRRFCVDDDVLRRWVRDFVDAGTAQVTNRPSAVAADQRDRFLAVFAHEIRSPLAIAQGWVGLLLDGDVEGPIHAETVRRLHQALATLEERTTDVELLAAASLGRVRVRHARVTLGALTDSMVELPCAQAILGEGPGLELFVDQVLFSRVLRDVWRAAHLEPMASEVVVETRRDGPWSEVRVARVGGALDHRVLQALFEPFDLNDDDTGVTMGLYLARALAVLHGGAIGVEQDHDTVLWIRVPRHPVPGAAPGAAPRRPQGGTR